MPAAAIVAAIIGVAGILISSDTQSQDLEEAQKEAKQLAMMKRQDELAWQNKQDELSKLGLEQRKEQFGKQLQFQQKEAKLGRAERAEERGYKRRQESFQTTIGLINRNQEMRNNFLNIWKGAR